MSSNEFKFENVQTVIAPGASVNGAMIADTINNYGSITIGGSQQEGVQDEYSKAIKEFSERINKLLAENKIQQEGVQHIQSTIDELLNEMKDVKDDKLGIAKKQGIKAKIYNIVAGLVNLLPKTAETAAAFTPLAPFGKLIGEGVQEVVSTIQKEE